MVIQGGVLAPESDIRLLQFVVDDYDVEVALLLTIPDDHDNPDVHDIHDNPDIHDDDGYSISAAAAPSLFARLSSVSVPRARSRFSSSWSMIVVIVVIVVIVKITLFKNLESTRSIFIQES